MDSAVDSALARERTLRLRPDVLWPARSDATAHRRRWPVLRRHLVAGDALAMVAGAGVGATVAGTGYVETAAAAGALTASWIVLGWIIGVYAGDDLRAWATGVPATPRVVITALSARIRASPGSATCCAGTRSTSCRSSSTCCAAR